MAGGRNAVWLIPRDNPFFTGVALLLWMIPIQLLIEVLLPEPTVIAFIGADDEEPPARCLATAP